MAKVTTPASKTPDPSKYESAPAVDTTGEKVFVFSTLACDQAYTAWHKGPGDMPVEGDPILIKGGTGVMNDRIVTPLGVMTAIDAEQVEALEANEVYKIHKANGFVRIERKAYDPEKVAADMALDDKSAPKTPADYANAGDEAKPKAE